MTPARLLGETTVYLASMIIATVALSLMYGCGDLDEPLGGPEQGSGAGAGRVYPAAAQRIMDGDSPRPIEPEGFYGTEELYVPQDGVDFDVAEKAVPPLAHPEDAMGSMWHGYAVSGIGFMDAESGPVPVGTCGRVDANGNQCGNCTAKCIMPIGKDARTTWKWRWKKSQCGTLTTGIVGRFFENDFETQLKQVLTDVAAATGLAFQQVTSGEHITFFCDDAMTQRMTDAHGDFSMFWYPYGTPGSTQMSYYNESDNACSPTNPVSSSFSSGTNYVYGAAGVLINDKTMADLSYFPSWVNCAGAGPGNPSFMRNVFYNALMHEVLHHFGIPHNGSAPMTTTPTCEGFGNTIYSIPSQVKNQIKFLRTNRHANHGGGGIWQSKMWRVDHQAECLFPHTTIDDFHY